MSKTLNMYITKFDYADKTCLVLSNVGSGIPLSSFTTVIGTAVGIENASNASSLMFVITNRIVVET